ncbi:MAG TPA: hypothetical protein VIF40_04645 [Methylosinus sp.]|uniref:hypothetical protein n=1 Tax=Hyphomicrobiales TaxID=356 RepID=UPI002F953D4D
MRDLDIGFGRKMLVAFPARRDGRIGHYNFSPLAESVSPALEDLSGPNGLVLRSGISARAADDRRAKIDERSEKRPIFAVIVSRN